MKKLLYLLPVAALALASCTNNDEPAQAPELAKANVDAAALQIFPVVNATTRISPANIWSDTNFNKFYLTASGQFLDAAKNGNSVDIISKEVSKATGSWVIAGAATYYWPSKTTESDFTAFTRTSGEYTASTTSANQEDIMVAYAPKKVASEYKAGVPLEFKHILSQIVFKADNADKNDITVKVAGIRINNIYSKGTFTLPTAAAASAWSDIQTSATYKNTVAAASAITLTDGEATLLTSVFDPQMLVPQTLPAYEGEGVGAYLSVLVQVTNATTGAAIYPVNQVDAGDNPIVGSGYAWAAVDFGSTTWEPGKKYIYTLHFTKRGIGNVDPEQGDGGTDDPADPTPGDPTDDDPIPGPDDPIIDNPIPLVLTVTVTDWEEVEGSYDL